MLRNVMLLFCISFVLFSTQYSAFSQKKVATDYNQAISANPIGLLFGLFNATYEHQVSAQNSFTVSGYYISWWTDWAAYGIGGSFRWYLQFIEDEKRPIEGFGFGPAIRADFWSWSGDEYWGYSGGTTFAIGGEAAYKWVFGGFVVEPIVQIMFGIGSVTGLGSYRAFGAGVNIGYAW